MKDLLTGETFVPRRATQKFAHPANRIKYYNDLANAVRKTKSAFDKPLHKNHKILNEIMGDKQEAVFNQHFLLGKGFDFRIHTGGEMYEGRHAYRIYHFMLIHEDLNSKIIRDDRY
jgi:hypothetical protein